MANFFYVYGIIAEEIEVKEKGFDGKTVNLIPLEKLFAVTSPVSEENFAQEKINENIKNFKWLAENAPVHEKVIEEVMQKTTIVPFRFCTIFKTQEHLKETLFLQQNMFEENLEFFKGKTEINVKAFFDSKEIIKQLEKELKEVEELKKQMAEEKKGKAYFTQQKIDSITKKELDQKIADATNKFFAEFAENAVLSKSKHLLKTQDDKIMCLNSVFLIEKNKQEEFEKKAKELTEKNKGFEVKTSKAFAPYDFVK